MCIHDVVRKIYEDKSGSMFEELRRLVNNKKLYYFAYNKELDRLKYQPTVQLTYFILDSTGLHKQEWFETEEEAMNSLFICEENNR